MIFDPDRHLRPHGRLSAREKKLVHWIVIALITISLLHEGGGQADWSFLALSVVAEFG